MAGSIISSSLLFGHLLYGYRNWFVTIASLFRIILGKFHYRQFSEVGIGGPLFLISFNLLVNMILMNMYISVLNDAFAVVQEENQHIENEFEVLDYLIFQFNEFIGFSSTRPNNNQRNEDSLTDETVDSPSPEDIPLKEKSRMEDSPTSMYLVDDLEFEDMLSMTDETEITQYDPIPDAIPNKRKYNDKGSPNSMYLSNDMDFEVPCASSSGQNSNAENDLDSAIERLSNYFVQVDDDDDGVDGGEQLEKMIKCLEFLYLKETSDSDV